jgi:hypothetical protein
MRNLIFFMTLFIFISNGCDSEKPFPNDVVVIALISNNQTDVRIGYYNNAKNGQYAHPFSETVDDAIVKISTDTTTIQLTHSGDGYYTDDLNKLPKICGNTYHLDVTIGDSIITASTVLPYPIEATNIFDTTDINIVANNVTGPFDNGDKGQKMVYVSNQNPQNQIRCFRVNQGGVFVYYLTLRDSCLMDFYFSSGSNQRMFYFSTIAYDSISTVADYLDLVDKGDKEWYFLDQDVKNYISNYGNIRSRSNINGGLGVFYATTGSTHFFTGVAKR